MALAVDGLSSNLDTTALINSLMQLEAIPQNLLKNRVSGTQSAISALQQLNAKIASLATLAQDTAKPAALDLFTAKTDSGGVTTTITSGASAASLSFVVDKVAKTQVTVTDALTAWPDTAITITGPKGAVEITAASTSLDDLVTAINSAGAGVSALKVAAGTNGAGDPQYRLQLTSGTSGLAGGFSVSGTAVATTEVTAAQDARIKLWAGTAAEQSITSSTNSFSNVLPGVGVTVSTASADPVKLTVARDLDMSSKVGAGFVSALNEAFAIISTKSVVTTSTGPDGKPRMNGGPFTGDSTVRRINQSLISAASMPVDGRSPSEIGISVTKTGVLEFNAEKFKAALTENPEKVASVMQELATRVGAAATQASDKFDGLLTSKITGQESLVKNMNTQISEWDGRLTSRRASLERTFVAMEVRLSAINSQSAWLTTQLSSLSPGKEK
jgi:flagellar hook-associated protein 2